MADLSGLASGDLRDLNFCCRESALQCRDAFQLLGGGDRQIRRISIRQLSPVWMASALQGKNALIARLVSTVLCPAFDRGVDISAGLDGFR